MHRPPCLIPNPYLVGYSWSTFIFLIHGCWTMLSIQNLVILWISWSAVSTDKEPLIPAHLSVIQCSMADALQNVWFIDACFVSPGLDICSHPYMFIFFSCKLLFNSFHRGWKLFRNRRCVYLKYTAGKEYDCCVNDCFYVVHIEQKWATVFCRCKLIPTSWLPVFKTLKIILRMMCFMLSSPDVIKLCEVWHLATHGRLSIIN